MEQIIIALEKFGLPVVMLGAVLWGIVKMFNWLANDLTVQIKKNEERIENIVIKLIDNSRKQVEAINKDRDISNQKFEAILSRMDALVDVMVKLTGNGLKRE
mgnify:CR=1 FL=1|tara:strand:+ start:562 stop:867 length:306 start_codon:yes stop_codon:yes gene_type:complete